MKLSKKEPTEQKKKTKTKKTTTTSKQLKNNQSRTIICQLLRYKDKKKVLKNCKNRKRNMFVDVDFSQQRVEHRSEL